jgi:hypothetical protein
LFPDEEQAMRCPFCADELDEHALVCRSCHRDTAVPAHLQSRRGELVRKRDALRAELDCARAELDRYRARGFVRSRPAH